MARKDLHAVLSTVIEILYFIALEKVLEKKQALSAVFKLKIVSENKLMKYLSFIF